MATLAAMLSAGCTRPSGSVAPPSPTVAMPPPSSPYAPNVPPATPVQSSVPVPIASLTGNPGHLLWSRAGRVGDRTVAAGDAVAVVEGEGPVPAPIPTPNAPPPPTATTFRVVLLAAATGKTRAKHHLDIDAATDPGPLSAKTYRHRPVAAISLPRPDAASIEQAYNSAGDRVWQSPRGGGELFGDEGQYVLLSAYLKPPAGGPLAPAQTLKTLTGREVSAFGPLDDQVVFVHHGTTVLTSRSSGFRVATIARPPRTLWSPAQAIAGGLTAAEPVAVVTGQLLVQSRDGDGRHRLSLHDLATGKPAWRSEPLAGGVTRDAVVTDQEAHIAVVGSDGTGPALGVDTRTGEIRWQLPGRRNFRPIVAWQGRVYGASGDDAVALDARTGRDVTVGTHVEIAGVTSDGVLLLHGNTSQVTSRLWAFRPPPR